MSFRGALCAGIMHLDYAIVRGIFVAARILIVDDSPLVRQRLRALLEHHPDWSVCAEAANGKEAVSKVKELAPDLIVLDFMMPVMNGLQAARAISSLVPGVPILMFSMHMSRQLLEEAQSAGARGAVLKTDTRNVVEGVEALLRHESYFHPPQ